MRTPTARRPFVVACRNASPRSVGRTSLGLLLLLSTLVAPSAMAAPDLALETLELPDGFSISVYASDLENARSLAMAPDGTLFIGSQRAGNVYAVVDEDGDFEADSTYTIASGLNMPNGVAFRDGSLYVAEVNRVLRFDDITSRLADPPEPKVLVDTLPTERHHGWKFIRFGPDGMLYVPVGAPCNICEVDDPYATILRMEPDTGELETYARGVRNTVGFDWHPQTGELWFTDNGRDLMGDDIPPDELNRAPEAGMHFGYPFCHGTDIADPERGEDGECGEHIAPELELGAHVGAVGMRFYTGDQFPESFQEQILIAEHGSWNRSVPDGYRVSLVRLDETGRPTYEPFIEGWLQAGKAWGRPVDVLVLDDGSLLVSDDLQGRIYRVSYDGN